MFNTLIYGVNAKVNNSGLSTDRNDLFFDFNKEELSDRFKALLSGEYDENFKNEYRVKDTSGYKITEVIKDKEFDASTLLLVTLDHLTLSIFTMIKTL